MTVHSPHTLVYTNSGRNMGDDGTIYSFICLEDGLLHRWRTENRPKTPHRSLPPTDLEFASEAPGPLNLYTFKTVPWR